MTTEQDSKLALIEELHMLYLDQQNGNLHDALKHFLKQQGISDPDNDPRPTPSEEELDEEDKEQAKLKDSYNKCKISQQVYIEFDSGGYHKDPIIIRCVKVFPRVVTGILKNHEGQYRKISINKSFYITNHMQTSKISNPKCLLCESMDIWQKVKIHKNYQDFDYNFDYDFGDL